MDEMAAITQAVQEYGYAALFPVLAFGGPAAALGAGFLASQGFFSPLFIWPLAVLADLCADVVWYAAGRFGRERIYRFFKNFFSVADAAVSSAERLFERRGNRIIFFSKTTMGLGFFGQFMLVLQGFLHIPFRVFIFYNFLAGVILSGAATFGGYYFGLAFVSMSAEARIIVFLGLFIAILVAGKFLKRFFSAYWFKSGNKFLSKAASPLPRGIIPEIIGASIYGPAGTKEKHPRTPDGVHSGAEQAAAEEREA